MLGYHAHAVLSEQEKRNVRSFVDSVLSTLRDGLPRAIGAREASADLDSF